MRIFVGDVMYKSNSMIYHEDTFYSDERWDLEGGGRGGLL